MVQEVSANSRNVKCATMTVFNKILNIFDIRFLQWFLRGGVGVKSVFYLRQRSAEAVIC